MTDETTELTETTETTPFDDFFDDIGGENYQPLPKDDYQGRILDVEIRDSKSGKMAHFTYVIVGDDEYDGRKIWDNAIIEGEKGKLWRIKQITLACDKVKAGTATRIGIPPHYDAETSIADMDNNSEGVHEWLDGFINNELQFSVGHKQKYGSDDPDEKEAYITKYIFDRPGK